DDATSVLAAAQRGRDPGFQVPCHGGRWATARRGTFDQLVDPGDQEEVSDSGLDGARPGEEEVRQGVPDCADAQLVQSALLPEQADRVEHPTPLPLRVVDPAKEARRRRGRYG